MDRSPATVVRRIAQCFARGRDKRLSALVERPVTDAGLLDREPVLVLDGRDHIAKRRPDRLGVELRLAGHPRAERVFLAPGEPGDGDRVVGLALDERQHLQHGVVQVGGEPLAIALTGTA